MRAILALRALIVILTLMTAGCGAAGPISPEAGARGVDRRPGTADDPCNPNSNPC
jgi:predicted small lipoprotein YifL